MNFLGSGPKKFKLHFIISCVELEILAKFNVQVLFCQNNARLLQLTQNGAANSSIVFVSLMQNCSKSGVQIPVEEGQKMFALFLYIFKISKPN